MFTHSLKRGPDQTRPEPRARPCRATTPRNASSARYLLLDLHHVSNMGEVR